MASPGAIVVGPVANIKVTSPAPQIATPLDFALPLGSTVRQLKERIMESVEGRPDVTQQRLIYRGKFLRDEQSIGGILGASANGEDVSPPHIICWMYKRFGMGKLIVCVFWGFF